MTRDLFISPHNDDESLFGAFTIQRTKALTVVVYDSHIQVARGHKECTWDIRRWETMNALAELHDAHSPPDHVRFVGLRDDLSYTLLDIADTLKETIKDVIVGDVYIPLWEPKGHDQHNLVSLAAAAAFSKQHVTRYGTYQRINHPDEDGKTRTSQQVPVESGEWVIRKLKALAHYRTQITIDKLGCRPHFMKDLTEYYG